MNDPSPHQGSADFQNNACNIGNQAGRQTINGGLHNHFTHPPQSAPTVVAPPSRCISVTLATVSTYAERPQLSQELDDELSRASGAELAHVVAVTGLGGTGKTQLVLRYLQRHQEEYETVLWLDVRSVETARSSYERCCRALGLPVENALSNGPLHELPPVQAVLSWLRARGEDKMWLVILDNADDLSWDVSSIVPQGKAGTVIVTSQDARASRLLGGQMATVNVDAMGPEEAVCVLEEHFKKLAYPDDACRKLIGEIAERLDRLAFALDLAGAHIKAEVQPGTDLRAALRQYISDYRHNQDGLHRDEGFASASPYKKTVWTAWETSLASLRKLEQSQPNIYPIHLLRFMTLLDRSNVQDDLFRLASLGLERACSQLSVKVPAWMQGLLTHREDGKWNTFSYRATVNLLLRYGLVRPVSQPWKGITMHGLVRWRASMEMDRAQYWHLYIAFIAAVCDYVARETGSIPFRRHVLAHLPPNDVILDGYDLMKSKGLWWMWKVRASMLWDEGRWKEAEELSLKLVETTSRALGQEHPDTLSAIGDLAETYWNQGRLQEAEKLSVQLVEAMSRVLGEEHSDTLFAMGDLAGIYGNQGRLQEAEELLIKVAEATSRVLGEEHRDTLTIMDSLAWTYRKQGRLREAEELLVKVGHARSRVLGEEHPDTITIKAHLARTYRMQGHLVKAEELSIEVIEAMSRVLGVKLIDMVFAHLHVTSQHLTRSLKTSTGPERNEIRDDTGSPMYLEYGPLRLQPHYTRDPGVAWEIVIEKHSGFCKSAATRRARTRMELVLYGN